MRSAVVIPVRLPPTLERIRRANVGNATLGVLAHITLLFPFVPAERLDASHRSRLARTVARSPAFDYELWSIERWPDTLYVAPRDGAPFVDLATRLADEWPEWPLYGGGIEFKAHVTIGEPGLGAVEEQAHRVARMALPAQRRATAALVIVEGPDGRWTTRWRLPLGNRV